MFVLDVIYKSPLLNVYQNNILLTSIKNICDEGNDNETILIGDFNLPNVLWESGSTKAGFTNNQILLNQEQYMNMFKDKGMSWYFTTEVKRKRLVKHKLQQSLLDQVLYTNDALVNCCKIVYPLGKSDHMCIRIDLNVSYNTINNIMSSVKFKPTWGKVSVEQLLTYSIENIDWNYKSLDSVETMWAELHGKLKDISEIIPQCPTFSQNRPVNLPWNTSSLKRIRKIKIKHGQHLKLNQQFRI